MKFFCAKIALDYSWQCWVDDEVINEWKSSTVVFNYCDKKDSKTLAFWD